MSAVKYLKVDRTKCSGCRVCEGACSIVQEGVLNKAKSRIRVMRADVLALNQLVCDQCAHRPCVAACPTGAIFEKDGQVRIRRSLCDGCGACAGLCAKVFMVPSGNRMPAGDGAKAGGVPSGGPPAVRAAMCNQCGACVEACPEKALEIVERTC